MFTQLRCIVAVTQNGEGYPETNMEFARVLSEDDRFVWIGQTNYWNDWVRGAIGGEDYWALADAFIAARRAGRVDRSQYAISDADVSRRI
ncbi:hypothetical protein B0H19DRAFT_1255207 [Mycena capillaripes]|nr:hypothetical protein B0H19DRAFT_1255207 [Mycena capillaripes]